MSERLGRLDALLRRLAQQSVESQGLRGANVFGVRPRPDVPVRGEVYMPPSFEEAMDQAMRELQVPGKSYVTGKPRKGNPLPDDMTVDEAAAMVDALERGAVLRSTPASEVLEYGIPDMQGITDPGRTVDLPLHIESVLSGGGRRPGDWLTPSQFADDYAVGDDALQVVRDRVDSMAANDLARYGEDMYEPGQLPVTGQAMDPADVIPVKRGPSGPMRDEVLTDSDTMPYRPRTPEPPRDTTLRDAARVAAAAGGIGAAAVALNNARQPSGITITDDNEAAMLMDLPDLGSPSDLPDIVIDAPDIQDIMRTPRAPITSEIPLEGLDEVIATAAPAAIAKPAEMTIAEYVAAMQAAGAEMAPEDVQYFLSVASRMRPGSNPRTTAMYSDEGDYIFSPNSREGRAERRVGRGLSRAARMQYAR